MLQHLLVLASCGIRGLGGLQRERTHNTAGFTLALPVSPFRVVGIQVMAGMVELALLALIPAILIPSLSILIHQSYPLSHEAHEPCGHFSEKDSRPLPYCSLC
jgi:hypothetical protein